jgi:hypothetical protein
MRRRIECLLPVQQYKDAYLREDFWRAFLAWEHEACWTIRGTLDFQPGEAARDNGDEKDEEMEDVAPLVAVKPEALIPDDYDEEAAIAATLTTSKANEDSKWSWPRLEDVVQLSAMLAEHVASLPLPTTIATTRATTESVGRPDGPTSSAVRYAPPTTPPQYVQQQSHYVPQPPEVPAWHSTRTSTTNLSTVDTNGLKWIK